MNGSATKQSQEETTLTLLAANHSLQREIAALRERIREAHAMLRPPSFTLLGEIYKPVIRRPELERWEATPEVQRALGEER